MWRILDIEGEGYFFHVQHTNISVEKDGEQISFISFDDVHSIVCHGKNNRFSEAFIEGCISHGIPITFCDDKHTPSGMLLPYYQHIDSYNRLNEQINAKLPKKKQAWQIVIKAKISAQADVLEEIGNKNNTVLRTMEQSVLSGDSSHLESQAARIYFSSLFGKSFKRDADEDQINALLDYGYSIIRSSVARAVVGSGLHPSLGIFHSGQRNPFCLIDDLMEPFRPIADLEVLSIVNNEDNISLSPTLKRRLIALSTSTVELNGEDYELTTALKIYVMDYFRFISGVSKKISIPVIKKTHGYRNL